MVRGKKKLSKKKSSSKIKMSKESVRYSVISSIVFIIVCIVVLYPLYFVLIASISNPDLVSTGKVLLLPKEITFDGYKKIFKYKELWTGYKNTVIYTLIGTFFNVIFTLTTAYPLTKSHLPGKKYILFFFMFTMYFSGGLIPTYLVYDSLNLVNTPYAIFLHGLVSVTNLIISMTFFKNSVPSELYDSAEVDGCSDFLTYRKIVLPLSKSLIAVMCLYYGVAHWNDYWTGLIYLRDAALYPLQLILRGILTLSQVDPSLITDYEDLVKLERQKDLIKYGSMVISALPMLVIFPFIQKYFNKGVMIGSVKG